MAKVWLGLGSNVLAEKHLKNAMAALRAFFGELIASPVYESEAVGFDGDNFLNMVVGVQTSLSVGALSKCLKEIEQNNGRDRSAAKFSARTLDIDILLYDDVVGEVDGIMLPRDEVVKNAFVLKPLSDILPEQLHPDLNVSYSDMWEAYDKQKQKLWAIEISL